MVDATDPNETPETETVETPDLTGATRSAEEFNGALQDANDSLMGVLQRLREAGASESDIRQIAQTFNSTSDAVQRTRRHVSNLASEYTRAYSKAGGGERGLAAAFDKMNKDISMVAENVRSKLGEDFASALGAVDIATAGFTKKAILGFDQLSKKITGGQVGFLDIDSALKDTEKSALRMGMAFGRSFDEAAQSTEMYRGTLADSIATTRASAREIGQVRDTLSRAFDTTEMTGNLKSLTSAQAGVTSAVNLTNVALLTATATGMEATQVADMLSTAHLELGESVETAGEAMANIADAAEGSGLRFAEVSQAIMSAASNLKMWGGTISSVTPVFKSFVQSLGEGRKGLATDLLNQYVGGLQRMGLSTRALLGIVGGMGGRGGALGAGLEMEAAMEHGAEGMQTITDNLIQALTQFGGGRGIITREQAIADPALQRSFLVQRQLLQQMLGVDQDSANQMMGILQDVEQSGLEMTTNTTEKLSELMRSGEDTQQSTQSVIEKTSRNIERATISSGKLVLSGIRDLARRLNFTEVVSAITGTMEGVSRAEREEDAESRARAREQAIRGETGGPPTPGQVRGRERGRGREGPPTPGQTRRGERAAERRGPPTPTRVQRRREREALEMANPGANREPDIMRAVRSIMNQANVGRMQGAMQRAEPGEIQEMMREASEKLLTTVSRFQEQSERISGGPSQEAQMNALERILRPIRSKLEAAEREDMPALNEQVLSDFLNAAENVIISSTRETERMERPVTTDRARQDVKEPRAQELIVRNERDVPRAPVRETAEQARDVRQREEMVRLKFKSEPVEQEVRLRVTADSESVSISVDDEHIKKVIREVEAGGAEN